VWRLFSSKSNRAKRNNENKHPQKKKRIIFICFIFAGVLIIAAGAWVIISDLIEDVAADREYEELREIFSAFIEDDLPELPDDDVDELYYDIYAEDEDEDEGEDEGEEEEDEEDEDENTGIDLRALTLDELAKINPDLVGWISIRGIIEFPVVRGSDNSKYLNTTFFGRQNSSGAIFMDYRNTEGFSGKGVAINGHNTRGGRMFAPLSRYLDPSFLARNSTIRITTRDGTVLTYTIFNAIRTDMWDSAYATIIYNSSNAGELLPGAPAGASRYLLLATCHRGETRDERILVFAASYD